jgi:hypothetical protein
MKKNFILCTLTVLVIQFTQSAAQILTPSVPVTKTVPITSSSLLSDALVNRRMTAFKPEIHGFKFVNTFVTPIDYGGINGLRLSGLCGGMVYSSLDYFTKRMVIPTQAFRPANRTPLQSYIYNRQLKTLMNNSDKWTELILNPFGWRTNEFFNWGLQGTNGGRIQELKELIDKGIPAPLGMFEAGDGGFRPHHQVLAIGYELGKYKGDLGQYKEDFKIFIYDPNKVGRIMTLKADPVNQRYYYVEDPACKWLTYFVDKKYVANTPPIIKTTSLPNDALIRELLIEIKTGGDDLRGGNDNVSIIVNYADGTNDIYSNVNKSARWIDNYCETVALTLRKPALLNKIKGITLKTSFAGGMFGDNWNVDELYIIARSGLAEQEVFYENNSPLVRFDGNNTPFPALFR